MALINSDQVAQAIPNAGSQTSYSPLIERVDAAIAAWLGFPTYNGVLRSCEQQTYTLYGNVPGGLWVPDDGTTIVCPVIPLASVTSLHEDPDWAYGSSTAISGSAFVSEAQSGIIRMVPGGAHPIVDPSPRAIRAIVLAGWTPGAAPSDVQQAAIETVRAWFRSRRAPKDGEEAGTFDPRPIAIPPAARTLLGPYRRTFAMVA